MRIIPAIDIIDGQCVRLSKGDYDTKKVYYNKPVEVAKQFEDKGIKFLHLVDLDGAKLGRVKNLKVLEQICNQTKLQVDFGGGLKNKEDLQSIFDAGATQATLGSIANKKPEVFLECLSEFSSEKVILGADCRNRKISSDGWLNDSSVDVLDFIKKYESNKVSYVVCTDIAKDGMLQGPSTELYQEIIAQTSVKLIASGGVSTMEDLIELKQIGCEGVILGKAIYEGKISIKELSELC